MSEYQRTFDGRKIKVGPGFHADVLFEKLERSFGYYNNACDSIPGKSTRYPRIELFRYQDLEWQTKMIVVCPVTERGYLAKRQLIILEQDSNYKIASLSLEKGLRHGRLEYESEKFDWLDWLEYFSDVGEDMNLPDTKTQFEIRFLSPEEAVKALSPLIS